MDTMKAWEFARYGTPEVLRLVERPMPAPAAGDVLVQVLASGVNPSDVKNVGGHFKSTLPRVPGRDFAGVIVRGDGRDGEEVWGSAPGFGVARDGTHQQYIALPSAWVAHRPRTLPVERAAAVGVPWLAAWISLVTAGQLRAGETLLVTGVAGAVGNAATQIAHALQARVIGVDRSSVNPSGADALIDSTKADVTAEARRLTDGKGVDMVLDAVGGPLFEACLRSLRKNGRQVAMASSPQVVSFNLVDFYHRGTRLLSADTMSLDGAEIVGILDRLARGFESGAYRAPKVQTWPFERAIDAYFAVAGPGQGVKQVLVAG